jgi:hypothetical protein
MGRVHYALIEVVKRLSLERLLNRKWLVVTKEMACKQSVGFTKTAELRSVGKLLYVLNGNTIQGKLEERQGEKYNK